MTGNDMKDILHSSNLSQERFAGLIGVNIGTVRRYINAEANCKPETVEKIRFGLHVLKELAELGIVAPVWNPQWSTLLYDNYKKRFVEYNEELKKFELEFKKVFDSR